MSYSGKISHIQVCKCAFHLLRMPWVTQRFGVFTYIHCIWLLLSMYAMGNPIDASKPHPLWKMYIEDRHRKYINLHTTQTLPENRLFNHLFATVT